jgi:hypothetical protein
MEIDKKNIDELLNKLVDKWLDIAYDKLISEEKNIFVFHSEYGETISMLYIKDELEQIAITVSIYKQNGSNIYLRENLESEEDKKTILNWMKFINRIMTEIKKSICDRQLERQIKDINAILNE